jgi:membrane protein DedA with SNARE-associated domain
MHLLELASQNLTGLLATYGYWAVLLCIALESMGVPLPGETMLLGAAVYAATTHHLHIGGVIAAAATGAILGDNAGFLIGREGGARLLQRYGHAVGLDERKLNLGRYLFARHGSKVVFFGRFIAMLRMWAAVLAGTYHMPWPRFLAWNMAGGVAWSSLYGLGGYLLGATALQAGGHAGVITLALGAAVTVAIGLVVRRGERRLSAEAERVVPTPAPCGRPAVASATTVPLRAFAPTSGCWQVQSR